MKMPHGLKPMAAGIFERLRAVAEIPEAGRVLIESIKADVPADAAKKGKRLEMRKRAE